MMIFRKDIYEMKFLVLTSECIKETKWHNTGMLMNMQENALKMKDYTNKQ